MSNELKKITIVFADKKSDELMLLEHFGKQDLIKGLVERGTLRSNSPNLPRTIAPTYDIEYGYGEMFVSDMITGEKVLECWF